MTRSTVCVVLGLWLCACASQWKIHGGPEECVRMCAGWDMQMTGMVGVGNQDATGGGATACVCEVRDRTSGGAVPPPQPPATQPVAPAPAAPAQPPAAPPAGAPTPGAAQSAAPAPVATSGVSASTAAVIVALQAAEQQEREQQQRLQSR